MRGQFLFQCGFGFLVEFRNLKTQALTGIRCYNSLTAASDNGNPVTPRQGLADQRLIDALDWLVSGSESSMQSIDALLTWGSSSGSDVFVGYVVALSSKISP